MTVHIITTETDTCDLCGTLVRGVPNEVMHYFDDPDLYFGDLPDGFARCTEATAAGEA